MSVPTDVPAESWLAQVPFARLRALVVGDAGPRRKRRPVRVVPLGHGEPTLTPAKRPLYVSSPAARLHLDGGQLVVEVDGDDEDQRYPLESLSHLTFIGHSRATVPLLLSLAADGVPSFFCRRSGEVYAHLEPAAPDWSLWMEQARRAEDEDLRLRFAQEVVAAKLHNAATLAVRFDWQGKEEAAAELRNLARSTANQGTLESLLGLEGRGAALYFAALALNLPPEWGFEGRRRQPPPDPVNAMLSFGYTLLYNHASTALTVAGLNPRIGLLHEGRGRHHALASDLVEEMRWLVDGEGQGAVGGEVADRQPAGRRPGVGSRSPRIQGRVGGGFAAPSSHAAVLTVPYTAVQVERASLRCSARRLTSPCWWRVRTERAWFMWDAPAFHHGSSDCQCASPDASRHAWRTKKKAGPARADPASDHSFPARGFTALPASRTRSPPPPGSPPAPPSRWR